MWATSKRKRPSCKQMRHRECTAQVPASVLTSIDILVSHVAVSRHLHNLEPDIACSPALTRFGIDSRYVILTSDREQSLLLTRYDPCNFRPDGHVNCPPTSPIVLVLNRGVTGMSSLSDSAAALNHPYLACLSLSTYPPLPNSCKLRQQDSDINTIHTMEWAQQKYNSNYEYCMWRRVEGVV